MVLVVKKTIFKNTEKAPRIRKNEKFKSRASSWPNLAQMTPWAKISWSRVFWWLRKTRKYRHGVCFINVINGLRHMSSVYQWTATFWTCFYVCEAFLSGLSWWTILYSLFSWFIGSLYIKSKAQPCLVCFYFASHSLSHRFRSCTHGINTHPPL